MQAPLPPMIIAAHISFPSAISQPRILSPRNHEDKGSHPYRAVSSNHLSTIPVRVALFPSKHHHHHHHPRGTRSSKHFLLSPTLVITVIVATRISPPFDTLLTGGPKRHIIVDIPSIVVTLYSVFDRICLKSKGV